MKRALLFVLAVRLYAQDDARAIFQAAMSKMQQAGQLAQEGKFGQVNELLLAAAEGMDRAIKAEPDNVEFRARRGVAFSFQSFVPGRAETATGDLKFVSGHPGFSELPEALRQQVARQLAALTTQPDRFPLIPEQTSPLIAVASFTLPPGAAGTVPAWVESTTRSLKGYPGLLGTHAMSSVDHPGMFIVFTWWKDKKALNDFFYGPVHQSWTRQRGLTMANGQAVPNEQLPSQTAIEIFAGMPGGSQIGGGVIPQAVFEMFKNQK